VHAVGVPVGVHVHTSPGRSRKRGAASWRAIFLINVPLGALAAAAIRFIPAALAPGRTPGARFDLPGLILLAAGLTGLLLGASQGGSAGWAATSTWAPLAAGVVLLACYARWAAGRDQPALILSLARQRVPALSMTLCALAAVVTWGAVFLLPVFVQSVQGRSALAAGLAMAPQGLVTGLSTSLVPRFLTRLSIRVTVMSGFALLGLASLGLLPVSHRDRHGWGARGLGPARHPQHRPPPQLARARR
jgi:Major Facilitator Superfamily